VHHEEKTMRKILAATDFSPCSDAALDLAVDLARRQDATLTLLHVCELPSYTYFGGGVYVPSPELVEEIQKDAQRGLNAARARLAERGVVVDTRSIVGVPGHEIVGFAREHGYDLIVVGTHGRRGLKRLLLGSVAETVVRTAEVPVLTARLPAGAARGTAATPAR
jgi:nucleotide-binding universal stress UspA family protein